MSAQTLLSAFVVLAIAATLAHPNPHRVIRTVDLSEVVNKTVCPIKVTYDEDPNRMPRRIKLMMCEEDPLQYCKNEHIPDHECCHHHHGEHVMECVEMKDTVLVFYKGDSLPKTYEVSVGCTCMIEHSTNAPDVH